MKITRSQLELQSLNKELLQNSIIINNIFYSDIISKIKDI